MKRNLSASTLKTDSDPGEFPSDDGHSIFMADAITSDHETEIEKDDDSENTPLLSLQRTTYSGSIKDDKLDYWEMNGHSVPVVIYASPVQPHLPSPSVSNSRVSGTFSNFVIKEDSNGVFLPHNWRTPAMVPYDVQAHPFNRAPNAVPQPPSRNRYATLSDTEGTGGSSRSSVWSVELEGGSCGCLSRYFP
jgi:hypothetical protein